MKKNRHILPGGKYFVLIIFAISAFAVYYSSIGSSFHFDDFINIVDNPDIRITGLSYGSLKKAAETDIAGIRPIAYLSFAANHYMSGLKTSSYRIVNIMIHVLNAFLVYLIILALFGNGSAEDSRETRLSALFTALIWLVTPLNSQAVIYIVQRMTLLMTFFFLAAFYAYLFARRKRSVLLFFLSGLFFAMSVLSKQNGIVLPIVILFYEFIFVQKGDIRNIKGKDKVIYAVMFLVMALLLFVFKGSIGKSIAYGYAKRDFSMYERVLTEFRVLVFYLSLLVLPLPGRLSLTHDIVKSVSLVSPATTLLSFAFITGILVFAVLRVKKNPYPSFALFWFLTTIFIESSILPLEMAYEHRMYLPSIFLIGAAVDFTARRLYDKNKTVLITVICGIAILLGVMTAVRGRVWRSGISLWSDVAEKYPNDSRAYYNVGIGLSRTGNFPGALEEYQKGLQADPEYVPILLGIGDIYGRLSKYDLAEEYYKRAMEKSLTVSKDYSVSLNNLGTIYINTGRYEEAEKLFKSILKSHSDLGIHRFNLGQALSGQKKNDEALAEYLLAIENNYTAPEAYTEALRCMLKQGNIRGAEGFFEKNELFFDELCLHDFIKGLIAEYKSDLSKAKEYYGSYLSCLKGIQGKAHEESSTYPMEAARRLKRLTGEN